MKCYLDRSVRCKLRSVRFNKSDTDRIEPVNVRYAKMIFNAFKNRSKFSSRSAAVNINSSDNNVTVDVLLFQRCC